MRDTRRFSWILTTIATGVALTVLTGCGSPSVDLAGACPKLNTSSKIPTCISLFKGPVGLKLPAGSKDAPIGAVSRGGEFLVTAAGAKVRIKRPAGPPTTSNTEYATTVYQATVKHGVATSLRPILRISENAMLTHTLGSRLLVGRMSARQPDGTYDLDPKLPVVIRLDARAHGHALHGIIANADGGTRLRGGRCVKQLPAGSRNPLVGGYSKHISILRVPSMHVPFDDELVLAWNESSSGMGNALYPSVATIMGHDRLGTTWDVTQHGVPDSGPELTLRPADGPIRNC